MINECVTVLDIASYGFTPFGVADNNEKNMIYLQQFHLKLSTLGRKWKMMCCPQVRFLNIWVSRLENKLF